MSRFSTLLQNINEKLQVPAQTKARILLEIAADLDDAYEFFREQGHSETQATKLAQERFLLDDAAIHELAALHQPAYRKILDNMSLQLQHGWERTLAFIILCSMAFAAVHTFAIPEFWDNTGSFIWPILGIGIVGMLQFIRKYFQLFISQKYKIKTLRSGIHTIAYLGVFSLALGFTGYFYEVMLYGLEAILPGTSIITVICLKGETAVGLQHVYQCILASSTVMLASLLTSMILALCWFILATQANTIEQRKARALLTS